MRLVLLLIAIGSSSVWAQEAAEPPTPAPAEPPPSAAEPAPTEPAPAETPTPEPGSPEVPKEEPAAEPTPKRPPKVRKKKAPAPAPHPVAAPPENPPADAGTVPAPIGGGPRTPSSPPGKPSAESERGEAQETARLFFSYLLGSDLRAALNLATVPFQLEERRIGSTAELMQEWLKQLREKRTELLTLYGIELLTSAEMEKKYGKPPERLKALPYREPHSFVAVANLSGHAAIAVLRMEPNGTFRVVGYTD